MRSTPLPPELDRRWGNLPDIYQRGPHEWSAAACPKCGTGSHHGASVGDRFRMFDDGKPRCYCRQCGYTDFANSDHSNFVITDDMRRKWLEDRERKERDELQRTQHALELLRKERAYLEWHNMIGQCGRRWWAGKGVTDYMIDYLKLGYCASKVVWIGDHEYSTPTATIPVFAPGWELMNVRHRLVNPPEPNDKYRPDRAGLPASLYLTNPNDKPRGQCLLVEGEIKSIVVYDRLEPDQIYVVGLPGKSPALKILDSLNECDRVYIILDPDATERAYSIAEYIGSKRARIISLPVKADDFFTIYGGTVREFEAAIKAGMRI